MIEFCADFIVMFGIIVADYSNTLIDINSTVKILF